MMIIYKEGLKDNFLKADLCHKIQLNTYWNKSSKDARIPLKLKGI